MISSLTIRNIGVISSAELQLGKGFTALTGETGAGKTMVLTALGLLMGERADTGRVRTGEKQLFVEGVIDLENPELIKRLEELGAEIEAGELIVNRSVSSEGRSRAALGGASVPVSQLEEIFEELVAVHGQSEQLKLRSNSAQREALDGFSTEIASALAVYQQVFAQYRELSARLERMRSASEADQFKLERIRDRLSQIEKTAPLAGELEELSEQIERLSNVESLREAAVRAREALSSDDSLAAGELVGVARKALETQNDPILVDLYQRLGEIGSLLSEANVDLSSYLSQLEADPERLNQLLGRKAELVSLERSLGASIEELLESVPALQAELLDLDSSDEQVERLEMQLEATLSQAGLAARELTAARTKAAQQVSELVTQELTQLAMGGSRFEIAITPLTDLELSGMDRVEFQLASHLGAEPRPLAKGASGGELSRIMLALELVLASERTVPTMVFDEVDAGVGGQAALELAKRLKKLSESTQVIVVTHLAQVAALADHQIRVSKDSSGDITITSVAELSPAEREVEIARMLSGNPDSESAISHAKELLNSRN
ncbi:MAG: DNA repair protein RecN [Aquiluna sp.]|nr:DNA repair protein RecN [Aquiluna sp.]